jgi:hypothetical protein
MMGLFRRRPRKTEAEREEEYYAGLWQKMKELEAELELLPDEAARGREVRALLAEVRLQYYWS